MPMRSNRWSSPMQGTTFGAGGRGLHGCGCIRVQVEGVSVHGRLELVQLRGGDLCCAARLPPQRTVKTD